MAEEIFELYQLIAIARSRRPTGQEDLSESEYLALNILAKNQPLRIGEVQKQIGVVPAQMSRIVRALHEDGGKGYIACKINSDDRRRIDISLTAEGRQAYENYRSARLQTMYQILEILPAADRTHFMRNMRQLRTAFEEKLHLGG